MVVGLASNSPASIKITWEKLTCRFASSTQIESDEKHRLGIEWTNTKDTELERQLAPEDKNFHFIAGCCSQAKSLQAPGYTADNNRKVGFTEYFFLCQMPDA